MRVWPWQRNRKRIEAAKRQQAEAARREQEIEPLVRRLKKHDKTNHFAARFRAAGLGGDR